MLLFGDAFGPAYAIFWCFCIQLCSFLGGSNFKNAFNRQLRYFMVVSGVHSSVVFNACVVVVVDSHIQRIVLATEETTVTQQVSHRPIKRQSRLWSQRGTKVNGSHHGDNPLLRPTGIQIATKSYATLQAMAPTNIKTVHQTSLLHSRATSIDSECCRLPTTSVLSKNRKNYAPTSFDQQVQVSQGHTFCTEIRKIEIPRSMVVEALNW